MIAIGWAVSSRIVKFKDYFLAGGALSTPLLICTLVSTYYELDVTIATSERGFYHGLVAWTWESRPYYLAILLAAFLLTDRIRKTGAVTLPDILEKSYGPGTRMIGAFACFVYSLPITAMAGLTAMFTMLGLPAGYGLLVSAGVCALYTAGGGLLADALTDTVQFVLMSASIAIAVPLALDRVGGFAFLQSLPPEHLTTAGVVSPWLLLAFAASALTVFVEPAFYQRMTAARSTADVRKAMLTGIFLWAAYDWAVTLLGMMARAAVTQGILPDGLEGKHGLVAICLLTLPVGLKGLFVAGILAAAMSSVDSYCLLAAGNLSYDLVRPAMGGRLSDRALVRLTRWGVWIVMALGVVASLGFSRVSDAWVFMASVLVAVVFVPVMGALFGAPARRSGLLAASFGLVALCAYYALIYTRGAFDPDEDTWVWRVGSLELWREYAVLVALPASGMGYLAGRLGAGR